MTIIGRGVPNEAIEGLPKPKAEVGPQDLDALRDLKTALEDVQVTLAKADGVARRLVNVSTTNFEVFSRIQEVLNLMCSPGDYIVSPSEPLKAVGIRMMLPALVMEIDMAIQRYEESKK
jgi:hypothetical protein